MSNIFQRFLHPLKKEKNKFEGNVNRIFLLTIKYNQLLNYLSFLFPVCWKQSTKTFTVSRKLLKIYWLVPIYKLIHAIFLTTLLIHGPLSRTTQLPLNAPAVLSPHIATLFGTAYGDIVAIICAEDIVNCFNWAYKVSEDFLSNLKFRKFND